MNLYGLGMTLFDMGELPEAARYLEQGLALAQRVQTIPDVLDNLTGLACILAQKDSPDNLIDAATTLYFVQAHPRAKEIARRDAGQALEQLRGKVSKKVSARIIRQAKIRAGELAIAEIVALFD